MHYSERRGIINQFEIDRATKMANYYNVPLTIVDFDYTKPIEPLLQKWMPLLKDRQLYSIVVQNHITLAEKAKEISEGGEMVFAGEISDGAHNLGFSQYATYFHPNVAFREFYDKMANYLMGPSFLKLLHSNSHQEDPMFKLFKERMGEKSYDGLKEGDKSGINLQMLSSLFLRDVRFPLYSLSNNPVLSTNGRDLYQNEMEAAYLQKTSEELTPENLYANYLHLYNSFHWQGATVKGIGLTLQAEGLNYCLPFWDQTIQQILSEMPETWGRALDLNSTKYPLKWMLKNRIDYPIDYQEGPHSYLYDVDPTFNHSAEYLYGSNQKEHFKSLLDFGKVETFLKKDYFNIEYVKRICTDYQKGVDVEQGAVNDLMSLLNLSTLLNYK